MRLLLTGFLLLAMSSFANAEWVTYKPLKDTPDHGPIVTDIERHLPARHVYRDPDKITWVHEGSHGIASQLRGKYRQPGFYLLDDEAYVMKEPKTKLSIAAKKVPESLRGEVYKLYCVAQQRYWNDEPSYLIDEWVAYFNGSLARNVLGIPGRKESVRYLAEMAVYSTCMAQCVAPNCSDCDSGCKDDELKELMRHMWEITLLLIGNDQPTIVALRTNPDAADLYAWMKKYFGAEWVATQFEDKPNYNIWD